VPFSRDGIAVRVIGTWFVRWNLLMFGMNFFSLEETSDLGAVFEDGLP